jgi:hypothetical protein
MLATVATSGNWKKKTLIERRNVRKMRRKRSTLMEGTLTGWLGPLPWSFARFGFIID